MVAAACSSRQQGALARPAQPRPGQPSQEHHPPALPVCCPTMLHSSLQFLQDLGDEQAPIDLKVNFGEQMLLALFRRWGERQRAAEQQQQAGVAPANSSRPAAALVGGGSGGRGDGEEEEAEGAGAAEQGTGEDDNMPDANGTG